MTAIDCSLSSGPESHANTNHNKFKLIRTANNEPRHSHHSICHSYMLGTKRCKRVRKKGRDKQNKQQKWCHTYWQRRQDKARHDEVFLRREDNEKRERQSMWGRGKPWENDQGDRESLVRVDSAVVSWQCQLDSRDVFGRHWLLRTWPLCVEPEQAKCQSTERWWWLWWWKIKPWVFPKAVQKYNTKIVINWPKALLQSVIVQS